MWVPHFAPISLLAGKVNHVMHGVAIYKMIKTFYVNY